MKKPLISIIIVDYKPDTQYLLESLAAIEKQTFPNFECIVIHDLQVNLPDYPWLKTKFLNQKIGAATKRDLGAKMAHGEILSFLDDDAYPCSNWLFEISKAFKNPEVSGVGGPGLTPTDANFLETASGWMSASPLGSGPYGYRFIPQKQQFVDDYPSMNLSVRKNDFMAVGGFDSHYWPGEDTKLCLDLVYKQNKKILYEPKAIVYHHRRPLWCPHLKQNGNFGLHRGYFAKALPKTSLRISYFLPSFLVLGLIYLTISSIFKFLQIPLIYQTGQLLLVLYLLALIANAIWIWRKSNSLRHGIVALFSVSITQFWYGIRFMEGFLLKKKLER